MEYRVHPCVIALPCYLVILAVTSQAATHYVSPHGLHVAPFTNWVDAATNLQECIDAAGTYSGDVLVTNGEYALGGARTPGYDTSNRVVLIDRTVRSVNGPVGTVIVGQGPPGPDALRCAYLSGGACLIGFTLSNGATPVTGGDFDYDRCGGGAFLEEPSSIVNGPIISNCIVTCNYSGGAGGGVYCYEHARVLDCTIMHNRSRGSGGGGIHCRDSSLVERCLVVANVAGDTTNHNGGGVRVKLGNTVRQCTIVSNAGARGGGFYFDQGGTLEESLLIRNHSVGHGGGIYFNYQGVARNCTIRDNSADRGGGVHFYYGGRLENCFVWGNQAESGGGVYCYWDNGIDVVNCTVTRNVATFGGGVYCDQGGNIVNSLVYGNHGLDGINWFVYQAGHDLYWDSCCTDPAAGLPGGTNCFSADPLLVGLNDCHILSNSPCINVGRTNYAVGIDIDGEQRISDGSVDIGCDEFIAAQLTGTLMAAIIPEFTNVVPHYAGTFLSDVKGRASTLTWDMGDGVATTDLLSVQHAWNTPNVYPVILSAANNDGVAAVTVLVTVVEAFTNYVSHAGSHVAPFTSWVSAATNIQPAINACAAAGSVVMVADGVYDQGSIAVSGMHTRVVVDGPVVLCSLNGADACTIAGAADDSTGTCGSNAVRCAYLSGRAVLEGFALSNGCTHSFGDNTYERSGGGAFCDKGGTLRHCLIAAGRAQNHGAGVYLHQGGAIILSTLRGNMAGLHGAGAYCDWGGTILNALIVSNTSSGEGQGGGVYVWRTGTCVNTTIAGNVAAHGGGAAIMYRGMFRNCIIYSNTAVRAAINNEIYESATHSMMYQHVCTWPTASLHNASACFEDDPLYVDAAAGNWRLQPGSPCIDAGSNAFVTWTTDLDRDVRIYDGTVDLGCYELVPEPFVGLTALAGALAIAARARGSTAKT